MHLSEGDILRSVERLKFLLLPGGVLYLSWRLGDLENDRSKDNRLYTFFDKKLILDKFDKSGILEFHERQSKISGKTICRLIYKKQEN